MSFSISMVHHCLLVSSTMGFLSPVNCIFDHFKYLSSPNQKQARIPFNLNYHIQRIIVRNLTSNWTPNQINFPLCSTFHVPKGLIPSEASLSLPFLWHIPFKNKKCHMYPLSPSSLYRAQNASVGAAGLV